MSAPSQIAIDKSWDEKAAKLITNFDSERKGLVAAHDREIESLKEQRNRVAIEERQKYLPMLAKMVPIEDVKELLELLTEEGTHRLIDLVPHFIAKHGDKLK